MNKFSNKTISQIGSYVYRLVGPKNGESITKIIGIILFNLEGTELENIGIEKGKSISAESGGIKSVGYSGNKDDLYGESISLRSRFV